MKDIVEKFNRLQTYTYWIFLYTANASIIPNSLSPNKIYIFPFSYFTQKKNGALSIYYSDRPLDFSTDDDLDLILKYYKLPTVQSISECNINKTTSILCLELQNKNHKQFFRHNYLFSYTSKNPPSYYIDKEEFLEDNDDNIMIPNNMHLKRKIILDLPKIGIVRTKIVLNRIFTFLFNDLFETIVNNSQIQNKEKRILRVEEEDTSSLDSDCSNDSDLSWYSYCVKYGVPTKQKTVC